MNTTNKCEQGLQEKALGGWEGAFTLDCEFPNGIGLPIQKIKQTEKAFCNTQGLVTPTLYMSTALKFFKQLCNEINHM